MANNSSKNLPSTTSLNNGSKLVDEKIDERILRLLNLADVFDIDYDTYASLLREKMVSARMTKKTFATEEVELITNEWKRIKRKTGRFRIKKITADSFKKGSATGIQISKKNLIPNIKQLALPPAGGLEERNSVQEIVGVLDEIVKSLTEQNKTEKKSNEKARKEAETAKRGLTESKLESGFKKAIQVAEKIVAPVKSLLRRIIDFITAIFVGRSLYLLLEWFGNKENAEKIKSISRFLSDHWPKLLALYLRFGTQFGRFVGRLSKLVIAGTIKIAQVAAKLLGAKKFANFLGGKGGKLLGAGLTVAATVGSTMALSEGVENFAGIDSLDEEPKQPDLKIPELKQPDIKAPKIQPVSEPKVPQLFGGGLLNVKHSFGFSGGGPGYVSGEKGIDKIPAMLSDGEFVMSRGAVQKYGVSTLESMNAAGGGTNKPRILRGSAFAQGGGLIATKPTERELTEESQSGLSTQSKISTSPITSESSNNLSLMERLKRIESQIKNLHPQKLFSLIGGGQTNNSMNMGDVNVGNVGLKYSEGDLISDNQNRNYYGPSIGDRFSYDSGKYFSTNMGNNVFSSPQYLKNINLSNVFQSRGLNFEAPKISQIFAPKQTAMDKWRKANPMLASVADERARIRGTAQTDNPLISKEMRARMSVTPTVQAPEVSKLGKGYQGLTQNQYAGITPMASPLKPALPTTSTINIANQKPNLKPPEPPQQPKVIVKTVNSSDVTNQTSSDSVPSTGGVPQVPSFSVSVSSMERRRKALTMGIIS